LNLSSSVKDLRRDLVNGYVIAEIIALHQKNVVSLPSYSNSHSTAAKKDNWLQLEKVFQKIDIEAKKDEFEGIKDGNLNQLILLLTKLCKFFTNKNIEVHQKRRIVEGKTKTYLLTETGLENINLENRKTTNDYKLFDKSNPYSRDPNQPNNESSQSGFVHAQVNPNDSNADVAVSRTDLLQMMETSEKGSDYKASVSSIKNINSKKELNFLMRNMDKSRIVKGTPNMESRFSGKRLLTRAHV
jgi:hypothetical protein